MIIDKETFLNWQEKVITKFYTDEKLKTDLFPEKNKIAVLKQSKALIVIDFDKLSSKVDRGIREKIPNKHKITLFHIGKMKNDLVSLGWENDIFSYPALDFGGLTNYKQTIGEKNEFKSKKYKIEKSTDITEQLNEIYNTWKKYNNKNKLYGNMKVKLNKFLRSSFKYLETSEYTSMNICFIKLPEVHRVLVSSEDIKEFTGKYYERIFKGDIEFAKISNGKNLYCAIQKGLPTINTNINKFNLLNEYSTY